MKFLFAIIALAVTAAAVPSQPSYGKDPYPAPCGRSVPSGRCMTEKKCAKKGGFYVQRDCDFYDVLDIGCCYDIPDHDF